MPHFSAVANQPLDSELPDEEEGRVALTSAVDVDGDSEPPSYRDHEHIALDDNESAAKELPKEKQQKVVSRRCCGLGYASLISHSDCQTNRETAAPSYASFLVSA